MTQIKQIDACLLYNLLQDTGVTKHTFDLRSSQEYDQSRARTSISMPGIENWDEKTSPDDFFKNKQFKGRGSSVYKIILIHNSSEQLKRLADYLVKECTLKIVYVCNDFEKFAKKYPFMLTSSTFSAITGSFPSEIIEDFMFLGSYESSKNKKQLDLLGITHILNMASELEYEHKEGEFKYHKCDANDVDGFDISQYFKDALEFIEKAANENQNGKKNKIFVHCAMGISRSATIVVLYLMLATKKSLEECLAYVKDRRSFVNPRQSFIDQILNEKK